MYTLHISALLFSPLKYTPYSDVLIPCVVPIHPLKENLIPHYVFCTAEPFKTYANVFFSVHFCLIPLLPVMSMESENETAWFLKKSPAEVYQTGVPSSGGGDWGLWGYMPMFAAANTHPKLGRGRGGLTAAKAKAEAGVRSDECPPHVWQRLLSSCTSRLKPRGMHSSLWTPASGSAAVK